MTMKAVAKPLYRSYRPVNLASSAGPRQPPPPLTLDFAASQCRRICAPRSTDLCSSRVIPELAKRDVLATDRTSPRSPTTRFSATATQWPWWAATPLWNGRSSTDSTAFGLCSDPRPEARRLFSHIPVGTTPPRDATCRTPMSWKPASDHRRNRHGDRCLPVREDATHPGRVERRLADGLLLRTIRGEACTVKLLLECVPRFEYGLTTAYIDS